MPTPRPAKRSVSPFGASFSLVETPALEAAFEAAYGAPPVPLVKRVRLTASPVFVPSWLRRLENAPANDALDLLDFCQFVMEHRDEFEQKGVQRVLDEAMNQLFHRKTEDFFIDHYDRARCEEMGWNDEFRDVVLYSKERDILVGRYFAPLAEPKPGQFAEFITHWAESPHPERILHLLDFCAGSKDPTFEHYLLFTHPALNRVATNKPKLADLFHRIDRSPLAKKFVGPIARLRTVLLSAKA